MNLSASLPNIVKLCLLIFVIIFITACGFPQDDKKEEKKSNTPPINTNNTIADLLNNTTVLALLNNSTVVGLLNNTTIVNLLNNTEVVTSLNDIMATSSLKQVQVVLGYRLYDNSVTNLPKLTACNNNSSSIIFNSIDNAGSLIYFNKDKSSNELFTGAVLPANYSIKVSCNGIDFESTIPQITNNATVTVTLLLDAKTYKVNNSNDIEVYIYQSSN